MSAKEPVTRSGKLPSAHDRGRARIVKGVRSHPIDSERFEAIMQAAERSGLLNEKSSRIGVRVSPALIKQAKRQTGIETDTDLIAFALATIALEDEFADTFARSRGRVDPKLKLGF